MPRMKRVAVGDTVYHFINRSNGRDTIFHTDKDYQHFESLLLEGIELINMRLLAYCIMPNHWHLTLYPRNDRDLGEYMRWVTTTHVRQRRTQTKTVGHGHLYQGTYKSFPVAEDKHLHDLIRYIEQNPLRAGLTKKAEEWQWSSLHRRLRNNLQDQKLLTSLPTDLSSNYLESVNTIFDPETLERIRHSIGKGTPYGAPSWVEQMIEKYHLESTARGQGRPRRM